MRRILGNICVSAILVFGAETAKGQCLSGTFTIGGASPDYSSVTAAVNDLAANGVCGPVIFNIRDGIYTEQVSIPSVTGSSPVNSITFQGENGAASLVTIQAPASSSSASNYVLDLDGTHYLLFQHLAIRRTGSGNYCRVILVRNGSSNIIVQHNDLYSVNTLLATGEQAVVSGDNSTMHGIVFEDNDVQRGSYGFSWYSGSVSSRGTGFAVIGNRFVFQNSGGITAGYQQAPVIRENSINGRSGIILYECPSFLATANYISLNNGSAGIDVDAAGSAGPSPGIISNNMITITPNSISSPAIRLTGCAFVDVCYNSVLMNNGGTLGKCCIISSGNDVRLLNNIFYGGAKAIEVVTTTAITLSDHNDLLPGAASNGFTWGVSDYSSLASWQTATGMDVNSLSLDPAFMTQYDLRINMNVDLDGAAVPVPGITTDIQGGPRSALTPDIGADEFFLPPDNAALFPLVSPVFPACPGVNNLGITFRNVGNNTITSIEVEWTVNEIPQPSFQWSGSVLRGDTSPVIVAGNYNFLQDQVTDVKVWLHLPNGNTDPQPANDTVAINGGWTRMAGTYTMGGLNYDYATLQDVAAALNTRGVCAPVIIDVRNGVHTGNAVLNAVTGTSAVNTITIRSESGDSTAATLRHPAGTSGANYILQINGASWVQVERLTFDRGSVLPQENLRTAVQLMNGSRHISFSGCIFSAGTPFNPPSTASSAALVYSNATSALRNDSLVFRGNAFRGGTYALYCNRTSSQSSESGLVMERNIVSGQQAGGVYIYFRNRVSVLGNTLADMHDTITAGFTGIYLQGCRDTVLLNANRIFLRTGEGISLQNCNAAPVIPLSVTNNMITSRALGIRCGGVSANVNVYFNSVTIVSTNSTGTAFDVSGTGTGRLFYSNSFTHNSGGKIFASTPSGISSNYNNFYTTGVFSSSYATFAAWTATGQDANSIYAVPGYISTTDMHIGAASPLNGLAIPYAQAARDIDGELRSTTSPDIGADEHSGIPADAGVTGLYQPLDPCHGHPDIKVSIKNFGPDTLYSFLVFTALNNTVVDTFAWSGLLLPGDTLQDLFVARYFFSYSTSYQLKAWTSLPNAKPDAGTSNDTLSVAAIASRMGGLYTVGGAQADFATVTAAVVALNAMGLCDSAVFDIRAGSLMTSPIAFTGPFPGSSASRTVTFRSESGDNASVVIYNQSAASPLVLPGLTYLRFSGVTLGALQYTGAGHHNEINNCIVNGKIFADGSDHLFSGNTFRNASLHLASATPQAGNRILQNRFEAQLQYDTLMLASRQSGIVIQGNYAPPLFRDGPLLCLVNCSGGAIIDANRLYSLNKTNTVTQSMKGLLLQGCAGTAALPFLVSNNMINLTGSSYDNVSTLESRQSAYVTLKHNTIMMDSVVYAGSPGAHISPLFIYNGSHHVILNNIILNYNDGPEVEEKISLLFDFTSSIDSCDFNVYYDASDTVIFVRILTGQEESFATWQSLYGFDQNSVLAKPLLVPDSAYAFINPNDPADNVRYLSFLELNENDITPFRSTFYQPDVPADWEGELRPPAGPLSGADEYQPHPDHNAGIEEAPYATFHPCAGSQPVVVNLSNHSLAPLTNVMIEWSVDGTLQAPFAWTGLIPPGDTQAVAIGNYNFPAFDSVWLKVWTTLPNGMPDAYPLYDTLNREIFTAMSGTYTVGGTNPDFPDLTSTISAMDYYGLCGPVIFDVRNGIYREALEMREVPGASAINTITYRSESGDSTQVILIDDHMTGARTTLHLNGADHFRFYALTITADNVNGYPDRVVLIENEANDLVFSHCYLYCNPLIQQSIYDSPVIQADPDYQQSHFNNFITIDHNRIRYGSYGFYYTGSSSSGIVETRGIRVTDNLFEDVSSEAISIWNTYSPVITGNTIIAAYNQNGVGRGIIVASCPDTLVVSNNFIDVDGNGGIMISTCRGLPSQHSIVANNSVSARLTGNFSNGIRIDFSTNIDVTHNSVYNETWVTDYAAALYIRQSDSMRIENNIFMCNGEAVAHSGPALQSTVARNNVYFTPATTFANDNGTGISTISGWYAATGLDSNSVIAYPGYATISDLHFSNSYIDNFGTPIPGVPFDLDGTPRSPTTPDPGCYEATLNALPADVSMTTLTAPDDTICSQLSPVSVTFTNTSANTLYGMQLNWSVNGIMQPAYAWPGWLAASSVSSPVTIGNYNFSAAGSDTLVVWLSMPNTLADPNPVNDTIISVITVYTVPATPVITVNGAQLSTTATAISYQWYLNGNPIPGATGPVYNTLQNGTYSLVVSNGPCSAQSSGVIVNVGIEETAGGNSYSIFPNPFTDHISFNRNGSELAEVSLYDMSGRLLFCQQVTGNSGTLFMGDLAAGIYRIEFISASGKATFKLIRM